MRVTKICKKIVHNFLPSAIIWTQFKRLFENVFFMSHWLQFHCELANEFDVKLELILRNNFNFLQNAVSVMPIFTIFTLLEDFSLIYSVDSSEIVGKPAVFVTSSDSQKMRLQKPSQYQLFSSRIWIFLLSKRTFDNLPFIWNIFWSSFMIFRHFNQFHFWFYYLQILKCLSEIAAVSSIFNLLKKC